MVGRVVKALWGRTEVGQKRDGSGTGVGTEVGRKSDGSGTGVGRKWDGTPQTAFFYTRNSKKAVVLCSFPLPSHSRPIPVPLPSHFRPTSVPLSVPFPSHFRPTPVSLPSHFRPTCIIENLHGPFEQTPQSNQDEASC